jgi:hypothetical protein
MDSVVQLVNRLQSAATLLGDNAASAGDKSLPSLWDLLPSIVVIGGQVRPPLRRNGGGARCRSRHALRDRLPDAQSAAPGARRAPARARCWRQWSARTSCRAARGSSRAARSCCSSCTWTTRARASMASSCTTTARRCITLVRARAPPGPPLRQSPPVPACSCSQSALAGRQDARVPLHPQRRGLLRTGCSGRHCVPIVADCCRSVSAAAALRVDERGPCLGAGGAAPDGLVRAQMRSGMRSRRRPGGT